MGVDQCYKRGDLYQWKLATGEDYEQACLSTFNDVHEGEVISRNSAVSPSGTLPAPSPTITSFRRKVVSRSAIIC